MGTITMSTINKPDFLCTCNTLSLSLSLSLSLPLSLFLLMQELHSSVEKMRPQLFRMASELQPNEEGMTDILKANDSLIRVLDAYEKKIGKKEGGGGGGGETEKNGGMGMTATSGEGLLGPSGATPAATGGGGGGGPDSSILLDLADLNFGNPPTPPAPIRSQGNEVNLLDDVGLGKQPILNDYFY